MQNRYLGGMRDAGRHSQRATDEFYDRATRFDARDYASQAAQAAYSTFAEDLAENIGALRGQQTAMGRLNTGFATEDEDRLVTRSIDGLNRELARNAFTAASLDQANTQMIGGFADASTNRYLELIAGGMDRLTAEENARRQRRGGLFGAIGGALGGIGGFLIGGPAGATAGAQIGSGLGSSFA